MNQTKAPKSTPSPNKGVARNTTKVGQNDNPTAVFYSMALDMSWRLAVVVLVPIIGGFELDNALNTSPYLTIVGFFLAMAGMYMVLKRTLAVVNSVPTTKKRKV